MQLISAKVSVIPLRVLVKPYQSYSVKIIVKKVFLFINEFFTSENCLFCFFFLSNSGDLSHQTKLNTVEATSQVI